MTAVVAAGRRVLPRGWADFGLQLGIWLGFYVSYFAVRSLADRNPAKAFANGLRVITFEQRTTHHLVELAANPYAAMPSLHAADALIVGLCLAAVVRRTWAKVLWLAWPAWVWFCVIATGNHFWLDVLAGNAVGLVALAFAIAAVAGSFLVSYTRARAEALGLRGDVGIGSRAERVVVITAGLVLAPWGVLPWAIALLACTAWVTVAQRVLHVRTQLRSGGTDGFTER